ncbi:MAG: DNA polymerase IV, partial [Candidatus Micrarchaeaceae archaeon]
MRIIMLIDMDSFFVACEELRRPEIRGKPVIVGADPKGGSGRGVVSTASYEARKYGIRSGMPISAAYRLKKDAIFLPVDEPYYESVSEKVMAVIRGFSEKFEQVSVDEAYIDVSEKIKDYDSAMAYAKSIKERMLKETGLRCSIGIGPNKLIAKMACEASKPDGIKLVKEDEAKKFLADMPIEKLYG